MHRLGVDLGGTKTEAVLLDGSLEVVRRERVPTPKSYSGILGSVASLISEFASGISDLCCGVCTPGLTSGQTGLMYNSNTLCLNGRPFIGDLERMTGMAISTENDANCFAMAEATMGAGRGYRTVFGVIMGTGVGGGVVIDGRPFRGRQGIAGDWGHAVLHPGGNPCYCGKRGCVETYISGPALEDRWHGLAGSWARVPEILQRLDTGPGRQWKEEFLENFGCGLANVINTLDPDAIVLGGGLSNISFLYGEGAKSVHKRIFTENADTPILQNELGDSAGVFGASMLGPPPHAPERGKAGS